MTDQQEIEFQSKCDNFVRAHVYLCLSGLVSTLAYGFGSAKDELGKLCEDAADLSCPVYDYEEAALDHIRNTATPDELAEFVDDHDGDVPLRAEDDNGNPLPWTPNQAEAARISAIAVIRGETGAAQEYCDRFRLDPYEWEIYEQWAISDYLAQKLRERGERIGKLAGLDVWGRTTTGQSIAMDDVIRSIVHDAQAAIADG